MSDDDKIFFNPDVDNEEVFDRDLGPVLRVMSQICMKHGILYVACFQYSSVGLYKMLALSDNCSETMRNVADAIADDVFDSGDNGCN